MKLQKVIFSKPIALPFARQERVINLEEGRQREIYELELDARGFVRVRTRLDKQGQPSSKVTFVGPMFIEAADADLGDLQPSAKR